MEAVLLGVSDRSLIWRFGKVKEADYPKFVRKYAELLTKRLDNVIITPDDGVYTDIALEFARIKGRKAIAYYPDKDEIYGIEHIKKNFGKFEIRKAGGDWYFHDAELINRAPVAIVLGFTPGVLIEVGYLKYHQKYKNPPSKTKVFIDERCIGKGLPESFSEQIKEMHYFSSFEELDRLLR